MSTPTVDATVLLRRLRTHAGWSQAALARAATTSQSAVARYEAGTVTPSLATLQRLVVALGHRLQLEAVVEPDDADVALAHDLLDLTPAERLATLTSWAALADGAGRVA